LTAIFHILSYRENQPSLAGEILSILTDLNNFRFLNLGGFYENTIDNIVGVVFGFCFLLLSFMLVMHRKMKVKDYILRILVLSWSIG
jgi:hypothetical protein